MIPILLEYNYCPLARKLDNANCEAFDEKGQYLGFGEVDFPAEGGEEELREKYGLEKLNFRRIKACKSGGNGNGDLE